LGDREIVYFKLYKSQIPVIDRALETAALRPGDAVVFDGESDGR
jgi:hypothetical protein